MNPLVSNPPVMKSNEKSSFVINEISEKLLSSRMDHQHLFGRKRWSALIAVLVLSIIGYFLFTLWGGMQDVLKAASLIGITGILLSLGLSLVNYLLRFLRWQYYLGLLGHRVPWKESLYIYIAGFALTTTPGKSGEALRGYFLKRYGVHYSSSLGALVGERFSDLIATVILTISGLWMYEKAEVLILGLSIFIVFVLLMIQKSSWLMAINDFLKKSLPSRLVHIIDFIFHLLLSFRTCFESKVLLYGLFLGILAWGAEALAFYYMVYVLGSDVSLPQSLFIYSFSMLVGGISFLPGGLGGAEVVMIELLRMHQMPISMAVAATVLIRITTLWFSVVLGLLSLCKFSFGKVFDPHSSSPEPRN